MTKMVMVLAPDRANLSKQLTNLLIMKYGEVSLGQVEAAINKLGGIEGFYKLLRGQLIISEKKWYEIDSVIYIKVISDGTTGEEWIERLGKKGFILSKWAKDILLSKDFKFTTGTVYTIAVLKSDLFTNENCVTKEIYREAAKRKLVTPNPEVACLIREMFSDKEIEDMGLVWLVTFHEFIKDSDGDSRFLNTYPSIDGSFLDAVYVNHDSNWRDRCGFVFEISKVSL